jgi:uncharacterized protein (TIGR03085 family)
VSESLEQRERRELCDLLVELGPGAPTMCEGWATADLAAHLVVREGELLAPLGIVSKRLAPRLQRAMEARKAQGFDRLVERLRRGPGLAVPWRLPGLRAVLNFNEFFIHHEDVRRANGRSRRTDRPDVDDALWRQLGATARGLARRVEGAGLVLRRPDGTERVASGRHPRAVLHGHPSELALYLAGRQAVAEVSLDGDDAAVAAVRAARFGV